MASINSSERFCATMMRSAAATMTMGVTVLLGGCQTTAASTGMVAQSQTTATPITWRTVNLGSCCSVSVPAPSIDKSRGTPIDSVAVAHFTYGDAEINAEVAALNGLTAPTRPRVVRNTTIPGMAGFGNTLELAVDERGTPARLSVNVQCASRNCALAENVFKSLRVRGGAIYPVS